MGLMDKQLGKRGHGTIWKNSLLNKMEVAEMTKLIFWIREKITSSFIADWKPLWIFCIKQKKDEFTNL